MRAAQAIVRAMGVISWNRFTFSKAYLKYYEIDIFGDNKKELFLVEEKLLVGDLCFETFNKKQIISLDFCKKTTIYFFVFLQKTAIYFFG